MKINLTATKDNPTEINIFADIFANNSEHIHGLTAEQAKFIPAIPWSKDSPHNTLLKVPIDEARKFAKQILKLTGD